MLVKPSFPLSIFPKEPSSCCPWPRAVIILCLKKARIKHRVKSSFSICPQHWGSHSLTLAIKFKLVVPKTHRGPIILTNTAHYITQKLARGRQPAGGEATRLGCYISKVNPSQPRKFENKCISPPHCVVCVFPFRCNVELGGTKGARTRAKMRDEWRLGGRWKTLVLSPSQITSGGNKEFMEDKIAGGLFLPKFFDKGTGAPFFFLRGRSSALPGEKFIDKMRYWPGDFYFWN